MDIRVKSRPNIDLPTLESICALFSGEYPEKKTLGRFNSETASVINGYLCTSPDKKQVVQVRLDEFLFSRLRPYETWDNLRKEARRLWQLYAGATAPEVVTSVALRYINRFEIPLPIRDCSDYLTAPPTIPQNLPQELIRFLTRNVIHDLSLNFMASIKQESHADLGVSNVLPVIIDIEVCKVVQYDIGATEIWDTIDQLREFKNKIFFESITEKTMELCK